MGLGKTAYMHNMLGTFVCICIAYQYGMVTTLLSIGSIRYPSDHEKMGKAYAYGLQAVEKAGHALVISPYLMMPMSMVRGDEIWDMFASISVVGIEDDDDDDDGEEVKPNLVPVTSLTT